MKRLSTNPHERAALNILRNGIDMFDEYGKPIDPTGRAQALALLAIGDHLKSIAHSLQILAKEDLVAEFEPEIIAAAQGGGTISTEEMHGLYKEFSGAER